MLTNVTSVSFYFFLDTNEPQMLNEEREQMHRLLRRRRRATFMLPVSVAGLQTRFTELVIFKPCAGSSVFWHDFVSSRHAGAMATAVLPPPLYRLVGLCSPPMPPSKPWFLVSLVKELTGWFLKQLCTKSQVLS